LYRCLIYYSDYFYSNTGIPLNHFYVLQKNSNEETSADEESYNLFVCLGLSSSQTLYSCPVRVDKFIPRRSIAMKGDNNSVSNNLIFDIYDIIKLKFHDNFQMPIIVSCQEYRGQIFISVHEDTSPQFLIQNKANMTVAIAQVLHESVTSNLYSFTANEELIPKNVRLLHMVIFHFIAIIVNLGRRRMLAERMALYDSSGTRNILHHADAEQSISGIVSKHIDRQPREHVLDFRLPKRRCRNELFLVDAGRRQHQ